MKQKYEGTWDGGENYKTKIRLQHVSNGLFIILTGT